MSSITRPRSVPTGRVRSLTLAGLQARLAAPQRRADELADILPAWHPRGSRPHWNGRALRQERARIAKESKAVRRAIAAARDPSGPHRNGGEAREAAP